jgi:hypothetical protein
MFKVARQKKPGRYLKSVYGYLFGQRYYKVYGITANGRVFTETYYKDDINPAAEFFANFIDDQPAPVYMMGNGKYASYTFNPNKWGVTA